jgi:GrpB-like predicted nucleotidyltransferase (UPF0157 family)
VVHVPPGGFLVGEAGQAAQLLAIVAGTGWASDGTSEPRAVRAGQAAAWTAGEASRAGTVDGFTAVRVVGAFDIWAVAVTHDIVVADYDPAWPGWFETLCRVVWPAVEHVALRIDHVGSTSVPGLAAKPIIDMDIVVASEEAIRPAIAGLATIGYRWRGDLGVTGRESFVNTTDHELPAHHLYLVVEDNRAHLDHWLLRDLLRQDPEARDRYASLKRHNASIANRDMDVYVEAKAALVAELLTEARAARGLPAVEYWDP